MGSNLCCPETSEDSESRDQLLHSHHRDRGRGSRGSNGGVNHVKPSINDSSYTYDNDSRQGKKIVYLGRLPAKDRHIEDLEFPRLCTSKG